MLIPCFFILDSGDTQARNLRKFSGVSGFARNIAQLLVGYVPVTCQKTCASRSCFMNCQNRAVFFLDHKNCLHIILSQ